jgi:hypothetical protein
MLKTKCRSGTFLTTWGQNHSPNSTNPLLMAGGTEIVALAGEGQTSLPPEKLLQPWGYFTESAPAFATTPS